MQAIKGRWVLVQQVDGPQLVENATVLIEDGNIVDVAPDPPANCELLAEGDQLLVLPGLVNLHNHILGAVPFRGLSEDMPLDSSADFPTELVYGLLMPMGDAAVRAVTREELNAVLELGLLELIKGGTTTLMEMFRLHQSDIFEIAPRFGVRFYGMPYVLSSSALGVDEEGNLTYAGRDDDANMLGQWRTLFDRYHGANNGRVHVGLGPHGSDSCGPDLLRAVRDQANETGAKITIHLSQTAAEATLAEQRHGMAPANYLDHVGLLGPDLLAAHCIFSSDEELALLRARGVSVASCPLTFARGGVYAPYHRFRSAGLRTVVGTDGYNMDIVGEIRAAGFVSKLHSQSPGKATARQLLTSVTTDAADFLDRSDLGRIQTGSAADFVIVDMAKPHFQPVSDPIKTFFWNASRADVTHVVIGGELIVEHGRFLRGDERDIIRRGSDAVNKIWDAVKASGTVDERYTQHLA